MQQLALVSSFLFLAFTSIQPFLASAAVHDVRGEPLQPGTSYYAVSAIWGAGGGGVKIGGDGNSSCPTDIVQAQSDLDSGIPVTFQPNMIFIGLIPDSWDLVVRFDSRWMPFCGGKPVGDRWKIGEKDAETGRRFLKVGESSDDDNNMFQIEKGSFPSSYTIKYCADSGSGMCQSVGIFFESGMRRLGLINDAETHLALNSNVETRPFEAVFVKA